MDSDLIASARMKQIAAEDRPTLVWYDETAFSQRLGHEHLSAPLATEIFRLNRVITAEILRRLPDEAFTWFKKAEGVVVDTHVHRISRRLELTTNNDPQKIEQDLMRVIPRERWILFSHQIIWHGRKLCIARKPKCIDCALENLCHAGDKTWSTVEMHDDARA